MTRHFPFLDRLVLGSVLSLYVLVMLLYLIFNATAEALPVSKGIFPVAVKGDARLVSAMGYTLASSTSWDSYWVIVQGNRVSIAFPSNIGGKIVGGFLYNDIRDVNDNILADQPPGYRSPLLVDEDELRQDVIINFRGGGLLVPERTEIASTAPRGETEVVDDQLDSYFEDERFLVQGGRADLTLDLERALKPLSFEVEEEGEELREPGAEVLEVVQRLFTPLVLILPIIIIANLFALIISREKYAGYLEVLIPYEGRWGYISRRMVPLMAVAMVLEGSVLLSMGTPWLDMLSTVALLLPMAAVYFLSNLMVVVVCSSVTQVSNLIILANMFISAYFIIPSFFLNVSERAALSPLSGVVQLLSGLPVDTDATLRALSFTLLVAMLQAYWLVLLFRGERVVAANSLRSTLSSALVRYAPRPGFLPSFFVVYGATAVLAGFVVQTMLGFMLARGPFLYPLLIAGFVFMEEVLKAWPLAFLRLPNEVNGREVGFGVLIGTAFFLTEKYLQLMFLRLLFGVDFLYALLHTLFQTRAIWTTLVVHPLATALFAHLRFRRGWSTWRALAAGTALHLCYNALVLSGVWI